MNPRTRRIRRHRRNARKAKLYLRNVLVPAVKKQLREWDQRVHPIYNMPFTKP